MKLTAALAVCAGLAFTGMASVGRAETVTMTYTGALGSLTDPSGVFGGAMAGDPFVLTFTGDFSRGYFWQDGSAHGDGSGLQGGTSYDASADPTFQPTETLSPISATLEVDGHGLDFSGAFLGEAMQSNLYPFFDSGDSSESAQAVDKIVMNGKSLTRSVEASLFADALVPFPSVGSPFSTAIDGVVITGAGDFDYQSLDPKTGDLVDTSGTLIPTELVVADASGAPEPASWLLMILGLGMAGAALRTPRRPVRAG